MRRCFFLLVVGCFLCGEVKGQAQQIFDEYLQKIGDHSELYVGKVEYGYPSTAYMEHPYWGSDDFQQGTVVFNGRLYRDVWLRFDAYLQQLVVRTPVKGAFVCVPMQQVDRFALDGMEFVRRNDKFVALLFEGNRVELVELLSVYRKERVIGVDKAQYGFKREAKYYVLSDKEMREVKNLKSVLSLYPGIKRELKAFAKAGQLNFKEHRRTSLASMIKYAEGLLAESSK